MKGWDTITFTGEACALHDRRYPVGTAETVVWYYEKNRNWKCQTCGPNRYCHHIEAVQLYERTKTTQRHSVNPREVLSET